ncbi:MAG TPA: DinB family protein [Thermoanaerobaculia bacterium]|nr:DinB family protein [Thermoanaerobaculia bacterium]
MKTTLRVSLSLLSLLITAAAIAQENPLAYHTKYMYQGVKSLLLKSAERMPEESYAFKPTESVRSFGQIVGHAADAQYLFCSVALGEKSPAPKIEQSKTAKADLIAALKDAFAYCDKAYDAMTDAGGTQTVKLFKQDMPKLGVLAVNNLHSTEHYGNLVVYLRLKNIVPPSSDPGFQVEPPKK